MHYRLQGVNFSIASVSIGKSTNLINSSSYFVYFLLNYNVTCFSINYERERLTLLVCLLIYILIANLQYSYNHDPFSLYIFGWLVLNIKTTTITLLIRSSEFKLWSFYCLFIMLIILCRDVLQFWIAGSQPWNITALLLKSNHEFELWFSYFLFIML